MHFIYFACFFPSLLFRFGDHEQKTNALHFLLYLAFLFPSPLVVCPAGARCTLVSCCLERHQFVNIGGFQCPAGAQCLSVACCFERHIC